MRRLFFILIAYFSLSGCGLFKKVFRSGHLEMSKVETEVKLDSIGIVFDKSETTIRETADTLVKVDGASSRTETKINIDSLIDGITAIKNDLFDVKLSYEPLTGILTTVATLKNRYVPIKIDRTVSTKNNISTTSSKKVATVREEEKKSKKKSVQKEPEKLWIWIISIVAGVVIILSSIVYWIKRKTF